MSRIGAAVNGLEWMRVSGSPIVQAGRQSAVGRWLSSSSMSLRPAVASEPMMAGVTGLLFTVGGLLALTSSSVLAPRPSHIGLMYLLGVISVVVGAFTVRYGRNFPRWMYDVLVDAGTLLITAMVWLAGHGPGSLGFSCVYVLVALDCFFFFAWPAALAHLALLEICSLTALGLARAPLSFVILQQGCAIAVAFVVGWLARAATAAELDPLTGLVNRRGFERALRDAVDGADRSAHPLSVVTIAFDRFKTFNDLNGRAVGDRVLRGASRCWLALLQSGQVIARLGGDEFAVILPDHSADSAARLADQLRAAVPNCVTSSAGVAEWRPGESFSMLATRSDVALYEAKSAGRNRTVQYGVATSDGAEIHAAIAAAEFQVFYQPIVAFATGEPVGDEALIRWIHPTRGFIPPDDFIPDAERSGAILTLGLWVLDQACEHAASRARRTGIRREIAVNVSGRELRNPGYVDEVATVLKSTGLDPRMLTIEITETTLDADQPQVATTLQQLRELGISIAIDDFGTGYSTLTRLSRLPVDILKIDKSFIDDIPEDGDDVPILQAIVGLARALNLATVAEGIETPVQARVLKRIGCTYAQGYLFGRPAPAVDLPVPPGSSRVAVHGRL